jgi:hypothetical protein
LSSPAAMTLTMMIHLAQFRLVIVQQAVEKVRLLCSRPLGNPHVPPQYAPVSSEPAALQLKLFDRPAKRTRFSTPC